MAARTNAVAQEVDERCAEGPTMGLDGWRVAGRGVHREAVKRRRAELRKLFTGNARGVTQLGDLRPVQAPPLSMMLIRKSASCYVLGVELSDEVGEALCKKRTLPSKRCKRRVESEMDSTKVNGRRLGKAESWMLHVRTSSMEREEPGRAAAAASLRCTAGAVHSQVSTTVSFGCPPGRSECRLTREAFGNAFRVSRQAGRLLHVRAGGQLSVPVWRWSRSDSSFVLRRNLCDVALGILSEKTKPASPQKHFSGLFRTARISVENRFRGSEQGTS